ncbi:DUF99 family protein [Aliikangiella sp. G2MR2-5]|uniref:endonuclease dU n=1 Tax=Aliikangiella sp. G2MR2-5 TaxID=2788943 RepID=UPI0018A9366F|nr:DUF99 family protein [Aliikangiella sp. G2MR2-5]
MKSLKKSLVSGKIPRVIGFDDAPFVKSDKQPVNISGVVCSGTRFEGMLWGSVTADGVDSTRSVVDLVSQSKFHSQLHAVLFDGLAFGGFNLLDLPAVSRKLELPVIAVMRKAPDLESIKNALQNFPDFSSRWSLVRAAGPIHQILLPERKKPFIFQVHGATPEEAAELLERLTDTGDVPEALRLAHLIGAAVKTGQSNNRA